ncbi:MAG: hypothetical protein AB7F43_13635 [Bacteriovoracia bacterium]
MWCEYRAEDEPLNVAFSFYLDHQPLSYELDFALGQIGFPAMMSIDKNIGGPVTGYATFYKPSELLTYVNKMLSKFKAKHLKATIYIEGQEQKESLDRFSHETLNEAKLSGTYKVWGKPRELLFSNSTQKELFAFAIAKHLKDEKEAKAYISSLGGELYDDELARKLYVQPPWDNVDSPPSYHYFGDFRREGPPEATLVKVWGDSTFVRRLMTEVDVLWIGSDDYRHRWALGSYETVLGLLKNAPLYVTRELLDLGHEPVKVSIRANHPHLSDVFGVPSHKIYVPHYEYSQFEFNPNAVRAKIGVLSEYNEYDLTAVVSSYGFKGREKLARWIGNSFYLWRVELEKK